MHAIAYEPTTGPDVLSVVTEWDAHRARDCMRMEGVADVPMMKLSCFYGPKNI
jgi:hypothetical protein